jgi:methionine aminopeptidase
MVGHSIVVKSDSKPTEGKKADVVLAAYNSIQAALRCLRPGNLNYQVTDIIAKTCENYKVNPLEGVISHDVKKFMIDGNNCIINKETFD